MSESDNGDEKPQRSGNSEQGPKEFTHKVDELNKALNKSGISDLRKTIEKASEPFKDLSEKMRNLNDFYGDGSHLGKAAKQIAEQQKQINALGKDRFIVQPREVKIPDIPPNPVLETNRKLDLVIERFDQIQDIATEAANIANELQAAAADFLAKFEKAAGENDRAARKAIWVGVFAVLMAFMMPAAQIVYSEFWRVPEDSRVMSENIEAMKSEIADLRQQDQQTAELIAGALENSDKEVVSLLRAILEQQQQLNSSLTTKESDKAN